MSSATCFLNNECRMKKQIITHVEPIYIHDDFKMGTRMYHAVYMEELL